MFNLKYYFSLSFWLINNIFTVAGLVCTKLSTSNISLVLTVKLILSPLDKQRTLLSSSTEFKFSTFIPRGRSTIYSQKISILIKFTQKLSTGPSIFIYFIIFFSKVLNNQILPKIINCQSGMFSFLNFESD